MTLKEVVQWLLDNGYGVLVNGQFVATQKLNREIGNEDPLIVIPLTRPQETVRISHITDKKEVWNKFCQDAEIPHRVTSPEGRSYTVRQYSKGIADKLLRIISDETIDYQKLVDSTKHYYKTVTYKALLSNYFDKEIWRGEYENYKGGATSSNDGSSRWED